MSFFCPSFLFDFSPHPFPLPVFCNYPGSLENGRVMLVGSLGLHEYRSYVKNVATNRQLTYECDKGFLLKGPPGSTCLNGEWLPSELPKCVSYNHPPLISVQSDYLNRRRRFVPLSASVQPPSRGECYSCVIPEWSGIQKTKTRKVYLSAN